MGGHLISCTWLLVSGLFALCGFKGWQSCCCFQLCDGGGFHGSCHHSHGLILRFNHSLIVFHYVLLCFIVFHCFAIMDSPLVLTLKTGLKKIVYLGITSVPQFRITRIQIKCTHILGHMTSTKNKINENSCGARPTRSLGCRHLI